MKQAVLGKRLATGAFAVLVAGSMSFPSMALALESGTVGETGIANGTENSGEGWSYDGADTIALVDYAGDAISTVGDTIISLEGENTVTGGIVTSDGDLTIKGDTSVPAEEKPVLNVKSQGDSAGVIATTEPTEGDLTIEGATVEFEEFGIVASTKDITIDNSSVSSANEDDGVIILSYGSTNVVESSVDVGAGMMSANDTLNIDNSEITADDNKAVNAVKGINLKSMANGVVKAFEDGSGFYIDTEDGGALNLKPATTPSYYKGVKASASATSAVPATGDSTGTLAMGASVAAMAAAAAMGLSLRRKHGKHEA